MKRKMKDGKKKMNGGKMRRGRNGEGKETQEMKGMCKVDKGGEGKRMNDWREMPGGKRGCKCGGRETGGDRRDGMDEWNDEK